MRTHTEEPHILLKIFGPMIFLVLVIFAVIYFPVEVYENVKSIIIRPDSISFEKSAYYFLGIGISLAIFSYILVSYFWFKVEICERTTKKLFRIIIGGLILGFILPHIVHFSIDRYLQSQGYEKCEAASYRWLHSVTLVYTKNQVICQFLMNNDRHHE